MSQQKQLELLNLWDAFQEASLVPDEADLGQLWNALDEALPVLNTSNQLQVTAEAIAQIAQLFQERSQLAFEELEATTREEGPVMPEDAFTCFVRQSMQIDFGEFIEPSPSKLRKPYEYHEQSFVSESSVVGVVDKEALLQVLEELEPEPDPEIAFYQAIEVAHAEDVSAWTGAIARYLSQQTVDSVGLSQLRQVLRMPLVEIWLGLLLGGYQMESSYAENSGDLEDASSPEWCSDWFYGSEIWVDCKSVVEPLGS